MSDSTNHTQQQKRRVLDEVTPVYRTNEELVEAFADFDFDAPALMAYDVQQVIVAMVEGSHGSTIDPAVNLDEVERLLRERWRAVAPIEGPSVSELLDRYEAEIGRTEAALTVAKAETAHLQETIDPRSFDIRVTGTKVDLVSLMDTDLTPPEEVAGSNGVILEGVAHLWAMIRKGGKSIATLATAIDIILAGGRVVILDRENGQRRCALRLKDIAGARCYSPEQLATVRDGLSYYEYPRLRPGDEEAFVEEIGEADLVVFDSSRTFLSSLRLKEDLADDYADFMAVMIEPIHQAGIASLILDNAGWSDSGRARGSSAKEDLNEQLFVSEKTEEFGRDTTGEILLGVKESRDGVNGTWSMEIGGGVYGSWVKEPERSVGKKKGKGSGQATKKDANKAKARKLRAENPALTDAQLAELIGCTPKTIQRYRKEDAGETESD